MKKREEERKTKLNLFAVVVVTLTLLLTGTLFIGVPVRAPTTIKIGVFGPEAWIQGQGMKEGAAIAQEQINTAGGILGNPVEVVFADELRGKVDPDAESGRLAAQELMGAGVNFAIGGFRTESAFAAREVFMDGPIIYFVAGASTDQLVDAGKGVPNPSGDVRSDYNRYRYTFRITPINSTMLFYSIAFFLKEQINSRLLKAYPKPIKIAVVSELLTWADKMDLYLRSNAFWAQIMGLPGPPLPGVVNVIQSGCSRVAPNQPDLSAEIAKVKASGAQLVIPVLSGPVGRTFINEFIAQGVDAIPLGIDVPGQEIPTHWNLTDGGCLYEGFTATAGQRTPINTRILNFYDRTIHDYGHAPIYTSYGVYDAMIAIDQIIEAAGRWPMTSAEMVPYIEKSVRPDAITGIFKYTGPHPMGSSTYATYMVNSTHTYLQINPTMAGTLHDIFMTQYELSKWWPTGFIRALFCQWQAGRLEVVFPSDRTYSKIFALPPWLYPYKTDVNQDAVRDITDVAIVSYAVGTVPGDTRWQMVADYTGNKLINGDDLTPVAFDFGQVVQPLPPP